MERLFIHNGNICTMDENRSQVRSVYAEDGVVKGLDISSEEEKTLISQGVKIIDLHGDFMMPGLHDSHLHMLQYGINKMDGVDLSGANSVEEIKNILKEYIDREEKKPGSWIVGYGWNHERFEDKKMPTVEDMNQVSREHYIVIKRVCIHVATVNAKLLELCGIREDTYRSSENVGRDEGGAPNGLIYEDAISNIIMTQKPPYGLQEIENIILKSTEDLRKCGFTTIQTDDMKVFSDFDSKKNTLKAFDNLRNSGRLPLRVMEQVQVTGLEELKEILNFAENIKNDEMFSVKMVKLILDGSLGGWTAAVSRPYRDNKETMGILNFTDKELEEIADFCYEQDWQMAFHAIGDRTIDQVLRIVSKMKAKYQKDLRPRIVHCQLSKKEQLIKMGKMGVLADIQPMFVPSDYELVEKRLEKEAREYIYAWKTLLECNVSLSGSSDSPVESYKPFYGIRAAVERSDLAGNPYGGWKPEQKLSVREAIGLYTTGSAYSVGKEGIMGSICEGSFSDFVVLDRDPYAVDTKTLHEVKIKNVIGAGR